MSSGNYAEPVAKPKKAKKILAELRQVKAFHLVATPANEDYWGKGGMDIEWLEASDSLADIYVVQALQRPEFIEHFKGTGGQL